MGVAVYAGVALWLTRGTTFYVDEVAFFQGSDTSLLAPFNGHLLLLPRAFYAASFELFGASYVPVRIVEVAGVALVAVLFFCLAQRRVGWIALAPTFVLLFFGSSWEVTLTPLGIPIVWAVAAGIGALIALERGDGRGDLGACALLLVALATFSLGLAFLAASAVAIVIGRDRWRRSWIVLIPLAVYSAWWLAKPSLETAYSGLSSGVDLGNITEVPEFLANAAAAVAAAVVGLNYDFQPDFFIPYNTDPLWGAVVAAIAVIALALRLRAGDVPPGLWTALALLLALWLSFALATSSVGRTPEQARYLYPAAVAVFLVAAAGIGGRRLSRTALAAIIAVAAVSVAFNIAHLRQGGEWLRFYSANLRAQLTAIAVASDTIDPSFSPSAGVTAVVNVDAGPYLEAVERIGSPGFSVAELAREPETVRRSADTVLTAALGITVSPSAADASEAGCTPLRATSDGSSEGFVVRSPGALLRSEVSGTVTVGRFAANAAVPVGSLEAGQGAVLVLPRDRFAGPWQVRVETPGQLDVCALET